MPRHPFPRVNNTATFQNNIWNEDAAKEMNKIVAFNFAMTVGAVAIAAEVFLAVKQIGFG